MGEHSFPKVFPYFFPLAVITLRAIWYIRYILKTDLNLMIPNAMVWKPLDRVKQIRIPHPLPMKKAIQMDGLFLLAIESLIPSLSKGESGRTPACRNL